jgi:hypothetical protein
MPQFKIHSPYVNTVENIWTDIAESNYKYIIGRDYRHPNHDVAKLTHMFEATLCKFTAQK